MRRFEGRVALVTGGAGGIGRAVARRLLHEGADVGILELDPALLEQAAADLGGSGAGGAGGREPGILAIPGDVTEPGVAEGAVRALLDRFGRLDVLVNNAGILRDDLLFRMSAEDWSRVLRVHLDGAFHCTRAAQLPMVEQRYGRIVTLSSTSALGNRGQANYAAAKAGLEGFTRTLAIELGPFGITANAVAPGFIDTPMTRGTAERLGRPFDEFSGGFAARIPVGRVGTPGDVAAAIAFLASEEAGFVNGQVLYVAGGPRG